METPRWSDATEISHISLDGCLLCRMRSSGGRYRSPNLVDRPSMHYAYMSTYGCNDIISHFDDYIKKKHGRNAYIGGQRQNTPNRTMLCVKVIAIQHFHVNSDRVPPQPVCKWFWLCRNSVWCACFNHIPIWMHNRKKPTTNSSIWLTAQGASIQCWCSNSNLIASNETSTFIAVNGNPWRLKVSWNRRCHFHMRRNRSSLVVVYRVHNNISAC